jgi:transglutaminase-like putative cysteine protease
MPASEPSRPVSLPRAIERYFDVSLYLLVLTGVGTLASTGTLDIPTVAFVCTALVIRGYLLAKRRKLIIPERWTTVLTIGYVIFYVTDYFLLSGGFLTATVHLVLFVMVVRLFSAQRDRDHYFLFIISFLMVLAAAVLTVDSTFLAAFGVFLGMAIVTCILMEMKHASTRAAFQSASPAGRMAHRRMAFSIASIVPALVLLIFLGGATIFFLLPRISVGYLGTFSSGSDLTTGFSDHVELGSIGRIQQSGAVVMHIRIDGDKNGSFDLKWGGITLNLFDGRTWLDSHGKYTAPRLPDGRFELRPHSERIEPLASPNTGQSIHYRILMEPIGANVFFLAPTPETLRGNYRLVAEDDGGAVFDADAEHAITQYEATSTTGSPNEAQLRETPGLYPRKILLDYLQLPSLDPRIPELARQITAQKDNNYDRAIAIENYLRTHFGYTLQLSRTPPADPLAEFLFVRKQGHCEYFASSMAIMLRTLRIPSRVVNGFRTGEFNDLTSQYVVRESDAHSWVESYFPGYGWVSFDPTPANAAGSRIGWSRAMLYMDALASFWREWVISYDATHQHSLEAIATRGSQQWFRQLRNWTRQEYGVLMAAARRTHSSVSNRPVRWSLLGVLAAATLALVIGARRLWGYFRRASLLASPVKAPRVVATIWYERMLRRVARNGWRRLPAQTPAEFLGCIEDSEVREQVARFIARYESARFGGSAEDATALPRLYEEIANTGRRGKSTSEVPDYAGADK